MYIRAKLIYTCDIFDNWFSTKYTLKHHAIKNSKSTYLKANGVITILKLLTYTFLT